MRILSNLQFWQSSRWTRETESIYPAHGRDRNRRAYSSLKEAILLWKRVADFDAAVTMGAGESLAYGLLCLLTGRPSKQIMTEVFVDDPKPRDPFWQLKVRLYQAVAARSVGILTNSTDEVTTISRRYRIPESKLRYVPMHTNILHPEPSEKDDGFVLSAGVTRRDYDCLLKAALNIQAPVIMICSASEPMPDTLPRTVSVLCDINRELYLDHVSRASLVVLPLKPTERATGQVVMLEAMALGKPVIATEAPGTIDHIRDGENGFLVPPDDPAALTETVNRLVKNPALRKKLGEQALDDVLQHNTIEIHAERKLQAIRELWNSFGVRPPTTS